MQQPDTPDLLGEIPHVVVDEVVYDDLAPWGDADGSGLVLQRSELSANGNLPTSWTADAATPGVFEDDFLLADVNQDGVVDFLDIGPFITVLTSGEYFLEADVNQDGVVDFLDIGPFISELTPQ